MGKTHRNPFLFLFKYSRGRELKILCAGFIGAVLICLGALQALAAPAGHSPVIAPVIALLLDGENAGPGTQPSQAIVLDAVRVGKDLQVARTLRFATAPSAPVDVSLRLPSTSTVSMSTDPAIAGENSVTFTAVTDAVIGTVYFQGIQAGQETLSVQADGYDTLTATLDVVPSTFFIETPSFAANQKTVLVNANGLPQITVRSAALNGSGGLLEIQPLRANLSVAFDVTSSNRAIGTVSNVLNNLYSIDTRLFMASNQDSANGQFWPLSTGMTELSIQQPEGFTAMTGVVPTTATVNAAAPSSTARFVMGCELTAGVIGTLVLDVQVLQDVGIIYGGGPDMPTVIGTGLNDIITSGMLASFYDNGNPYFTDDDIRYSFTGSQQYADFYGMDASVSGRFRVEWTGCSDTRLQGLSCSADMVMIINPFGQGPTWHQCQTYNASFL